MSAVTAVAVLTTGWALTHPAALIAYACALAFTAMMGTAGWLIGRGDERDIQRLRDLINDDTAVLGLLTGPDPGPMQIPTVYRLSIPSPPAAREIPPSPAGDAPGPGSTLCPGTDGAQTVHAPGPGDYPWLGDLADDLDAITKAVETGSAAGLNLSAEDVFTDDVKRGA